MSPIDDAAIDDLEIQVERYESARVGQGRVEIESFLPDRDHPQYAEIAAELIRVDLEYGWREGNPRLLDWYHERFPDVFENRELVAGIAFEEYRLRCQSGESVLAEEYRDVYGVDVSRWPSGKEVERPWSERSTFRRSRRNEGGGRRGDSVSIRISEGPRKERSAELCPLLPGSRCFGFEIESELGRGSSAIVYLAKQESLANRHVVLKMSNVPTAEPERLARLQHANIVPLFSYHQQDGLNVMCLPYLGRHTLLDWISHLRTLEKPPASTDDFVTTFSPSGGPEKTAAPGAGSMAATEWSSRDTASNAGARASATLELAPVWQELRQAPYEKTVLRIVTDLARGLAYAHGQQILHLDLKPGNILLTDDGRPMLLDFHLSAKLRGDTALDEVGGGTLPYMSPEQLQALYGRATVDAGSDLFSLGVVLFELLTGKLPYPNRRNVPDQRVGPAPERRHTNDVLRAMEEDRQRIPSIRKLNPLVSPGTAAIIRKCLHPNSRLRYQSASQLVEDLERQQQDRPLRFAPNPSLFERFRKWRRRHPRLTLALPITAASLAGTVLLLSVAAWNLKRVPELEAVQCFDELSRSGPELKALLFLATVPERPVGIADPRETVEKGRQLIAPYGVDTTDQWMKRPFYRFLPPEKKEMARKEIGQMLFLLSEVIASSSRAHAAEPVGEDASEASDRRERLEQALHWNRRAYECLKDQGTAGLVLRQQASLLRRLGRAGEADAIDQDLAERKSFDVAWLLLETSPDESHRDAEGRLDELLKDSPSDFIVWFVAGNCYLEMREYAHAENCFTVCVTLDPNSTAARMMRVESRLYLLQWQAALNDCAVILSQEPRNPATWFNRGLALRELGRPAEAVAAFEQARLCGFPATRIHILKSACHTQLGDWQSAAAERDLALTVQPVDGLGWTARGHVRLESDPEGALDDFRKARATDPRCFSAILGEAHVLSERLDKGADALEAMNNLLAMTSRDPLAWSGRAVLNARAGNSQRARADISAALQLSREPLVVLQAACVEALDPAGNGDRALALLAEALIANPTLAGGAAQDRDLSSLQARPEFQRLIDAAETLHRARSECLPNAAGGANEPR